MITCNCFDLKSTLRTILVFVSEIITNHSFPQQLLETSGLHNEMADLQSDTMLQNRKQQPGAFVVRSSSSNHSCQGGGDAG